jgi:hypothetical protein
VLLAAFTQLLSMWTRPMVTRVIVEEFSITYHPAHVSRLKLWDICVHINKLSCSFIYAMLYSSGAASDLVSLISVLHFGHEIIGSVIRLSSIYNKRIQFYLKKLIEGFC